MRERGSAIVTSALDDREPRPPMLSNSHRPHFAAFNIARTSPPVDAEPVLPDASHDGSIR